MSILSPNCEISLATRMHLVILVSLIQSADSVKHAIPVYCSPHLSYIQSDPPNNKLLPYMFEIHRCGGSEENPAYKRCVPTSDGVKTVPLKLLAADEGKIETVRYENHTKCELVCVTDANTCSPHENYDQARCACDCKYSRAEDTKDVCTPPFQFKRTSGNCDCVCPNFIRNAACGLNEVFSEKDCGCVCKMKVYKRCARKKMVINEECNCDDPSTYVKIPGKESCNGGVTGRVLAVIIILVAICIVGGYLLFYVCCYKQQYKPRHEEKRQMFRSTTFKEPHPDSVHADWRHNEIEEAVERLKDNQRSGKYFNQDNRIGKFSNSDSYYPCYEKSQLTPKSIKSEEFIYDDVFETEGDMYYLHDYNVELYCLSEYDRCGYASVTRV